MNINVSPHRIGFMTMPSGRVNSLMLPELGIWTSPKSVMGHDSFRMKAKGEVTKAIKKSKRAKLVDVIPIKSCLSKLSIECSVSTTTRRRVRFQLEADGEVATNFEVPCKVHYLTPEERKSCWWTKKELMEVRKRAVDICRYYLSSRPDYHLAAIRMMERCGAEQSGNVAEIESAMQCDEAFDEEYDLCLMVQGEARGLEKRLFNAFDLPFLRYKHSIASVLSTQSRLAAVDTQYFSSSKKVRLIASQYSSNAYYAAMWARKLAMADAQTLENNYPVYV